jgi:3-oxoacyl-[acyl-carrier protein] reductase
MKNSLIKKTVLVTGSAGDIGSYIAGHFSKHGWTVVGVDKKLQDTYSVSGLEHHHCDLSDPAASSELFKILSSKHGAFDVVINCAGMIANEAVVSMAEGEFKLHNFNSWDEIIRSNLYTAFNVSVPCIGEMIKERKQSIIINISSVMAKGNPGQAAYSAAKAGLNGMTMAMAKELGPVGIRVVAIAPGFFDTPSTRTSVTEEKLESYRASIPLKKLGDPMDIVRTIEWIIETEYVNGTVVELDGGLTI